MRVILEYLISNMATARETFAGIEDRLMIHGKPVSQLKTEELKSELELRGLTTSGSRKNLQDRLCEYLEIERERSTTEYSSTSDTQETDKKDASPKSENGSKEDSIEKNEKDQSESKEKQDKKDPDEKEMNEACDPAESESNNSEMKAKLMQKDMPEVEEGEIVGQDEEKKNKVQKTSQPEKKRRISLTRQKSNATPTPGSRKRKWSSMSSKNKSSVVISTGSLKGLIPGVQLASTPALEAVMDLDDEKEDEEMISDKQKEEKEPEIEDNVSDSKPEERNSSKKRIVHVEESKKVKLNNSATADIADIEMDVNPNDPQHPSEGMVTGTTTHEEDLPSSSAPSPETNLKPNREVSPPRNPPSVVIHVNNLVRPFTQKQLNELLAQYGPLAEGGFWMNKIKSHCYVTYTSVEDAKIARDGLHGQRWPATSPKFLSVDFGEEEQMAKDTEGNLGKKKDDADQKEKEKEKENEKEKGKEKEKEKEKEKDKGKEKESRRHKERKEQKQKEEPSAANLLDKLFRKTTTMPCIYWLPLTKEQIAKKDNERDERRKQRQLAIQEEEKQRADRLKVREKEGDTGREKERERSRGRERQPLRDNRAQTPSSKIRSDRRSADLKKRSRSRSKEIGSRRDDNRRRIL